MFNITKCKDYNQKLVSSKIDEIVDFSQFIEKGDKVLVKPNLLAIFEPEKAITAHPAVVKAVVQKIQALGASVIIADSPRWGLSKSRLRKVYEKTGMTKVAEETGCTLNYDTTSFVLEDSSTYVGNIKVISAVKNVDKIVNICKVKTHTMAKMTCAVKNLYGLVPGWTKMQYHGKSMDMNKFSKLLIKLNTEYKPAVTIVDGIIGMEGNGPDQGDPKQLGILAAGTNSFEIDYNINKIIGVDYRGVSYLRDALKDGLFVENNTNFDDYKVPFKPANLVGAVKNNTENY